VQFVQVEAKLAKNGVYITCSFILNLNEGLNCLKLKLPSKYNAKAKKESTALLYDEDRRKIE